MPHRQHLFSLRLGHALRESIAEGYGRGDLMRDLAAGVTVGVIAIPLAMALAIASGVPPQYGLYTSIIAGGLVALAGGSRFSISGPTAAFVVILYPLAGKYGLAGLLLASIMAGFILIGMAFARLGRFIEYIPESVTLGFTGGIAIVIVVLQIPDFMGLDLPALPEGFVGKARVIAAHLPRFDIGSVSVAAFTLAVMLLWPRLGSPVPPHLPALVFACLLGVLCQNMGVDVDTIGSRFHYLTPDGTEAAGIPPFLPAFEWPWNRPGADGEPLGLSLDLVADLLPAAFAIAMLGAIESLLCAVVLDGMSGKRHSANSELLAQGVANVFTPFFGGITATAAIARSATNFKAGAVSPIAAVIHAAVVLLGLLLLAGVLALVPMPAMAALLMVVAWNMSEARKSARLVKHSPKGDVLVLLSCLLLTVLFDMVIAITVGIVLASLLFMREIAALTRVVEISDSREFVQRKMPANWKVFKVRGPLFFAAADRIFAELAQHAEGIDGMILNVRYSSYLDAGGLAAMEKLMAHCEKHQVQLVFAAWQFQPMKTLARARGSGKTPLDMSFSSLELAIDNVLAREPPHEIE
ncbi:C4-dicarboxylic acid transporter DauA [Parahaliea mediterranea]|uniref:C4-dicarboxylic acid transporter DauA n=1 Tax=Parahaliea mediterranea TaxID=651086 RepID=A0A939DDT9_9GAMM|nr:C4-dicarboxylic acid transporter DauA [Parahaliea mediterranea]MBN7796403.1 C4-dicarboxylic acid transporter DauA [Parahaliea mediterranea]